jgi:hypothetical protein
MKHPEFLLLSLSINGSTNNLFTVVCERHGTSFLFQWLLFQPKAEETLLKSNQNGWDCFSSAMHFNRRDCLRILFDTYGMEAFQASSIDDALSLLVEMGEVSTPLFLLNELDYVPKPSNVTQILIGTFRFEHENVELFIKLHKLFTHKNCPIDHQKLFRAAIISGKPGIVSLMHGAEWITPDTMPPIFETENDFDDFIREPASQEIIGILKDTGYQNAFYLNKSTYLIKLLNLNLISVDELLNQYPISSPVWGNQALMAAISSKGEERFKTWLTSGLFPNQETGFYSFLAMMNTKLLVFQPEHLERIQEEWDATWLSIAANPTACDDEKLARLIESIARSPNPTLYFKKLYEVPVTVSVHPPLSPITVITHYSSFTPLQLLIVLDKPELAVGLIERGFVDCKLEVPYTISTSNVRAERASSPEVPGSKSILDLARCHNVETVVKALQVSEVEAYLYKRALEGKYKTQFSFFGWHIHFGFSKQEKIKAARALIHYLKNDVPVPESCRPALSQGELSKIVEMDTIVFTVSQDQPSPGS